MQSLLTPMEIAEEKARREIAPLVKKFKDSDIFRIHDMKSWDNPALKRERNRYERSYGRNVLSTRAEMRTEVAEVTERLREIGLVMASVYIQTLKKDLDLQVARTSINVTLDNCYRGFMRGLMKYEKDFGPKGRQFLLDSRVAVVEAKKSVFEELQIASFGSRPRKRVSSPGVGKSTATTPIPGTSFLKDDGLNSFARNAAREACRCLDAGAFTAAAAMAGSAAEAVILDVLLQQNPKKLGKTREELHKERLADLINLALRLGLLGKSAARLSHVVREHRDLVHPARALRERTILSRGKAEISLGILRDICEEMSRNAKPLKETSALASD
jgi:hypothetical protein